MRKAAEEAEQGSESDAVLAPADPTIHVAHDVCKDGIQMEWTGQGEQAGLVADAALRSQLRAPELQTTPGANAICPKDVELA
jgi:hypothetical protein